LDRLIPMINVFAIRCMSCTAHFGLYAAQRDAANKGRVQGQMRSGLCPVKPTSVFALPKETKQIQEEIDDVQVQGQSCEHVVINAELELVPTHLA